jgi:hypothetical protein
MPKPRQPGQVGRQQVAGIHEAICSSHDQRGKTSALNLWSAQQALGYFGGYLLGPCTGLFHVTIDGRATGLHILHL